eukprot:7334961-Lingulodinium_polyedra.AAC.1
MLPCVDLHQWDSGALVFTKRSRTFYNDFPVQGPPPSLDPAAFSAILEPGWAVRGTLAPRKISVHGSAVSE